MKFPPHPYHLFIPGESFFLETISCTICKDRTQCLAASAKYYTCCCVTCGETKGKKHSDLCNSSWKEILVNRLPDDLLLPKCWVCEIKGIEYRANTNYDYMKHFNIHYKDDMLIIKSNLHRYCVTTLL